MNFTVENTDVNCLYLRVSNEETAYYRKFSCNDFAIAEFDSNDNLVGIKISDAVQYILSDMKYLYSLKDINYYCGEKVLC